MVIFINTLDSVVIEKEYKLRHGMEMMGLKPGVYWASHFFSNSLVSFISSISTSCIGLMFGFQTFKSTDFRILFLTFFLLGESMILLAFFISTIVSKQRIGIMVGVFVFIIGILFQSFVFSSGMFGYIWWKETTSLAIPYRIVILT
jgi:ABC-type transport system involved in multi-copper enzyme maturation permease subunit